MDAEPAASGRETELAVEATRIARRLLGAGCRVVGALPVASAGPIHEPMCAIGRALVDETNQTAAVIDAGCGWPMWNDAGSRSGAGSVVGSITGRWLHGGRLAALRPATRPAAGRGLSVLSALLGDARLRCPYALVDMSGLRATGEHLGAFTLVDGVCLIARSGKTRERELLSVYEQLDPLKNLGVLLLSP